VFIAAYYTKLITVYLSYYKKAVWGYELLKYLVRTTASVRLFASSSTNSLC